MLLKAHFVAPHQLPGVVARRTNFKLPRWLPFPFPSLLAYQILLDRVPVLELGDAFFGLVLKIDPNAEWLNMLTELRW